MTKQDIIHQISGQTGVNSQISQSVLDAFFEVVKSAVVQGETVYIRTFGSFGPKHRAAKVARHINQNTALTVEACTLPAFKPSREFVNQVRLRPVDPELTQKRSS